MNFQTPKTESTPTRDDAERALLLLRKWLETSGNSASDEIDPLLAKLLGKESASQYPALAHAYPEDFTVDSSYIATLPDLQNGPASSIKGAQQNIQHVGISNFRLPVRFRTRDHSELSLASSVTGTVSLEAGKKGINMSRIMRTFYKYAEETFSFDVIEHALDAYKTDLESFDARILMTFSFPMKVASLRSGLEGFQYYDIALELVEQEGVRKKIMHLDYVYSSTCPCSLELSEHARQYRGQLATPHSQRSVARISVELKPNQPILWFEDLVEMARKAVPTETQVMVKREDEQAFAELNAANPIFVEDAARLFCQELQTDERIGDFKIVASHQESLHSHDAVSILVHGKTFSAESIDPKLFPSLIHRG
ncbi:MAG: GTP cyclohydrolase FolE2 [Paracoccaceae bacterium]|nr:GTP cyclohydrolase FolE2 [Paracoccaceae bacterium]